MQTIRTATAQDVPLILEFIRQLALYEHEPDAVKATEADLLRDGFGPAPFYRCLIGEVDGKPAGFSLFFFNYSTWRGHPGIYLEDLFVLTEFRGLGLGKALLAATARLGVEMGCTRMDWEVLDWNQPSIDFYKSLGAQIHHEWLNVRLTDGALSEVASQAPGVQYA